MSKHPTITTEDLRRAIAGDEAATARVVTAVRPLLRDVVRGVVNQFNGRLSDVDDLLQEVLVALLVNERHALTRWQEDGGRTLPSFLAMFARYRTIDRLRRQGREIPVEDQILIAQFELKYVRDDARAHEERDLFAKLLQYCQDTFSSDERWLLGRLMDGADAAELAHDQKISVGTMYQRISRLRRRTRDALQSMSAMPVAPVHDRPIAAP